jgi:hypothetical protein
MSDSPQEKPGQPGKARFELPPLAQRREIIRRVLEGKRERRKLAIERMAQFEKEQAKSASAKTNIGPLSRFRWPIAAGLAAVIAFTLSIWWTSQPREIRLTGRSDIRTVKITLPKNLRLDLKSRQLELSEDGDRLSGRIEALGSESSRGVAAFDVTLAGRDTAGFEGRFRGILWLTNSSGATAIRKQADVVGGLMRGSFEIAGKMTNAVSQSFAP